MRRVTPGIALASLLLGGCGLDQALARVNEGACFAAAECGAGFICVSGQCVPNDAVGPDQVHVEIAPPSGSPYARAQMLDTVAIGGLLNLQFPTPTEFEVRVLDGDQPIGATIAVFGAERIPDREVDLTQSLNPTPTVVRLLPGSYRVRLLPDDRNLPGFEATDFVVRNNDTRQAKEFLVPAQYRILEGSVVSSVAGSSTIAGVIVRAVGQRSGLPSTESISGPGGRYSIQLPHTTETQFLLTARHANPGGPAWHFEQLVKVETDVREKRIELELTSVALRGQVKLKVLGRGAEGGPEPVANANVTLTATTATGLDTRMYRLSGVTDSDGFVSATIDGTSTLDLPILAERYLVEVHTPQRSRYASTTQMLDLSAAGGLLLTEQIELDLRTRVSGSIASASGSPIGDALVELIPLDERGPTVDTETEPDGTFTANLDPGAYLIVIRPPRSLDGELLPVHTAEAEIGDGVRFQLPPINLPVGTEVSGTIKGEGAGPIDGARVEFFIRQGDRTVSIARTISDSSGFYSVVLPNPR